MLPWLFKSRVDARGPVVDGDIVVWLVPHALGGGLFTDLGRAAVELDGGRILRARLVAVGSGLVGRICAERRGHGPRRRGSQGRGEDARCN
jgi:hypothetical protein